MDAITFGTDGWRARLSEFTTPRVRMVGQAVAAYLDDTDAEGGVAVGYDAREHSRGFAEALADVLAANGRNVTIAARDCPTPALAWTAADGAFAGGFMVTASHNPPDYNGVKFVTAEGTPALPAVTDALEERLAAPEGETSEGTNAGATTERDLCVPYREHVRAFVDTDLDGVTVAYDAMHGSGRGVTDELLAAAGATVERLRCARDPEFGGVAPEPGPDTAAAVRERVCEGPADIGFINDGDADRVGIVTPQRGYLDPNVVLAVLYDILLDRGTGDVVRTVSTSSLVDRVADAAGQSVHETAVGFKWVAAALREHDTLVGGEESGGYGVPAHLPNKDGVLVAALAAAAESERPLDARIDDLLATHGTIHQGRVSLDCPEELKTDVMALLADERPETVAGVAVESRSTVDGVKFVLADGDWLLVRPSGTEPKLRVYAESDSEPRLDDLLEAGQAVVEPLIAG
jgi:phosphomannomutase